MRNFMLISVLLLSFLVDHQAQGRRFMKGSLSTEGNKVHEDKSDLSRSNLGLGEMNPSMESQYGSESGANRKLMTKTFSTSSTTTSENGKNDHQENKKTDQTPTGQSSSDRLGGKQENFSVNSSTLAQHPQEVAPNHYPDILDIAGMDYSPARRKPPIHN